jgi:hypothetical protein
MSDAAMSISGCGLPCQAPTFKRTNSPVFFFIRTTRESDDWADNTCLLEKRSVFPHIPIKNPLPTGQYSGAVFSSSAESNLVLGRQGLPGNLLYSTKTTARSHLSGKPILLPSVAPRIRINAARITLRVQSFVIKQLLPGFDWASPEIFALLVADQQKGMYAVRTPHRYDARE